METKKVNKMETKKVNKMETKNVDVMENVDEVKMFNDLFIELGIDYVSNERVKLSKKQKLINHIKCEIDIMKKRSDLNLITHKKGDIYVGKGGVEKKYKLNRNEIRFHKIVNGEIRFFIKYKGIKFNLSNSKKDGSEIMRCELNLSKYINMLSEIKNWVGDLNEDNLIFNQIK